MNAERVIAPVYIILLFPFGEKKGQNPPREMKRIAGLYVAWLVAAGLLVSAAAERHPYSFYTLLRWICCPVFAYSAFAAHERSRVLWVWVFGVLAALYNPIFRVHLDRSTWLVVNWFTVAVIIVAIVVFWASEIKVTKETTLKDEHEGAFHMGLTQAEEAELRQLGRTPYVQLTNVQISRWTLLDAKRDRAKAEVLEKRIIIGVSIATLVLFYLAVDTGIRDYKRFNKADREAAGQVVELQVVWDWYEGGRSRFAHCQFEVGGIHYDGRVGNSDLSLAKGDPIQVRYNSSDPKFHHAQGDAPHDIQFLCAFFGVICLCVVFFLIRDRRKKSHLQS